jgi:hypothetical protein
MVGSRSSMQDIDLQEMSWKIGPGLHEQTGVSLKERLCDTSTGGHTREHEDTGK